MITFVEDEYFTKAADRLLSGDELFSLMQRIAAEPDLGDMIPQSGGCRKLRFAAKGKGSRSGVRVIYFHRSSFGQILLLDIYAENEKANLTSNELKVLKQKVKS